MVVLLKLDLQACYSDTLQELRSLELQREALVFQVDCLQDALERAEEMLAEAQRETGDTSAVRRVCTFRQQKQRLALL